MNLRLKNIGSNADAFSPLVDEEWRDVVGFEGLYKVSNFGRVLSLRGGTERLLSPYTTKLGYKRIGVHIRPYHKLFMLHRWVAEAFIPNPNNLPFINHKDENPSNNRVDNLEWCTRQYNNTYGNALKKAHLTRKQNGHIKTVYQFDLQGNLVAEYGSMYKASQATGVKQCHIAACIKGEKSFTAKGFIFLQDKNLLKDRFETIKKHRIYYEYKRCGGYW